MGNEPRRRLPDWVFFPLMPGMMAYIAVASLARRALRSKGSKTGGRALDWYDV